MKKPNYTQERVELQSGALIWPEGDFIVEQEIKPSYYMEDSDAEESLQSMQAMARIRSAKIYLLIDMKNIKGASAGARRTLSGISPEIVKGVATLIANPVSRLLSNFILGLNKPKYPAKAFSDREQARAWLTELRAKEQA
ncbi:hypothetical protein [Saprospira grandis]|uniref:DUF7793 family protein n=1 Tax=Saprospira grandis TaxID=1008 RepID=UPI0022DD2F53|nr:hypothetical protein [Saprospira grandis]WBM74485.1 hypothetical protein OP864_15980 [Saprospira grandis]